MSIELIKNLQKAELYNHTVQYFKVIETHISWVILTGEFVYKIKKPYDFAFLNFTTLEKRKYYCELELQLNKKLAAEIYLEVVAITGTEAKPVINGESTVIEYALKMREFPQDSIFTHLLETQQLTNQHISQTAKILAQFHAHTEADSSDFYGTPAQIFMPVIQNFEQIRELLTNKADLALLAKLETWTRTEHQQLLSNLQQRKTQGFIRACHGDVHLGNIALFNNKPIIFDCIEFNESFRWTDVMADTGFMLMDLQQHQQFTLANIFINQYLLASGDYSGLPVLKYYQIYRAMVRAKINLFQWQQNLENSEKSKLLLQNYRDLIKLAENYTQQQKPFLIITHGFSGSGKSTLAKILVEQLGLIQIRADVERKRLHGLNAIAKSSSGLYADLYSEEMTDKTYTKLLNIATIVLNAQYSVIVDATFLKANYRKQFKALAKQLNVGFVILHCQAPLETLLASAKTRQQQLSISEADTKVILAQQQNFDPLTAEELDNVIQVDTTSTLSAVDIVELVRAKLGY